MAKTRKKSTKKTSSKNTKATVEVPVEVKDVKQAAPAQNKRQVKWVLTVIMSIIFGYLGVDRFMMGHVGLGILKLVTFGGCGIWWLIDIILIASKNEFKGIEWVE
jgi:hypothetical protein